MGKGWFSGVWGSVNLSTCSPWAELPHRLTMEMLALEKCLYSGASRSSVEGVAAAANFGTCLSLNGVIAGSYQCFRLFPGRGGGRRGCLGSAERCPLQAVSEVTEGALAGKPGRVRIPGIPAAGLGQKGPQRSHDPIPSFYQWEDRDAPGKGLIQSHPGRPSQLPGSCKQPEHPPRWLCSHPSLGPP